MFDYREAHMDLLEEACGQFEEEAGREPTIKEEMEIADLAHTVMQDTPPFSTSFVTGYIERMNDEQRK